MKKIVFIRHAKSSWADSTLDDFDRPLNERGKIDAPLMASKLKSQGIIPDLIVSSPAKRAKKTAKIFSKVMQLESEILFDERIYEADEDTLLQVIHSLPTDKNIVFMFGHNPGFTWVVNQLCNVRIDNIPTCGFAIVACSVQNWNEICMETNTLEYFDYPKNFLHT